MKYKYPKKIRIGSTCFNIKYNKKHDGASFSYNPENGKGAFIEFGIRCHEANKGRFLEIVIHELKEIIQVEQSVRFDKRTDSSYEFHYGHAEHEYLCGELSRLLRKFIK